MQLVSRISFRIGIFQVNEGGRVSVVCVRSSPWLFS